MPASNDSARYDIMHERLALDRYARAARLGLLVDLNLELQERRAAIYAKCADMGHEYEDLPNNGINGPHFATGKWPAACKWCRRSEPND